MQQLNAQSLEELKQHLAAFGDEYLFRGQAKHYALADGSPVLNSSFIRQGCVPPLMLKWIFFVDEFLRRGGFDITRPDASNITQGLLQHYGWRSFFVDLSASQGVAAWFASHVFTSDAGLNFCENSFEEPVMLRTMRAQYSDLDGIGQFYVLKKSALVEAGHKVVSLVDDLPTDCSTRFEVQKAWLASLFYSQKRLEPSAIVAHITAPAHVFRELASSEGFTATDDLFPSPSTDEILKHLLSLPYIKLDIPGLVFPTYMRSLEIPEYQDSFRKHLPTTTVLAKSFWPSDLIPEMKGDLCIRVEEDIFYGVPEVGAMPSLVPYLADNAVVHIETNKLICFPIIEGSDTFEKGMAIRRSADGLYEIGAIAVDFVSDRIKGVGVMRGYFYRIENGHLVRVPTETDCPCGDERKHFFHLRACAILNELLAAQRFKRTDNILSVGI